MPQVAYFSTCQVFHAMLAFAIQYLTSNCETKMQIQQIELKKLKPWEKNPRINDHAVESVAESISAFGFNVPILCDPQFTIIAGHTRWKAAKKLKMETVPVVFSNITFHETF